MMTVEEAIKSSQCFGIAFDPTVKECSQCDVHLRCEQKCRMGRAMIPTRPMPTLLADEMDFNDMVSDPKPAAKPAPKPSTKPSQASTPSKPTAPPPAPKKTVKDALKAKTYSADMPEFKGLTLQQMEDMVVERGGDLAEFEKYKVENIRRMRLTMFLKKTYEI